MKHKALVILSGGQDSATCLFWALKNFEEVCAITFFYGQNHAVEIALASNLAKSVNVKHRIVFLNFFPELIKSALTSNGDVSVLNEKGLPASFVPNRNALFITLSHAYAQKIGASTLITGVCQTDYSGYPDCRRTFIDGMQQVLNIGSDSDISILTPLMFLTKAETFKLAEDLGCLELIIESTNTCYHGEPKKHNWGSGCGECPACELRKKGFEEFLNHKNII